MKITYNDGKTESMRLNGTACRTAKEGILAVELTRIDLAWITSGMRFYPEPTRHLLSILNDKFAGPKLSAKTESERPSVLYRPTLTPDGNQWCALYGADLVTGVAGFGDTPEAAMASFDLAWRTMRVHSNPPPMYKYYADGAGRPQPRTRPPGWDGFAT